MADKLTYKEALTYFTKQIVKIRVKAEHEQMEFMGIIDSEEEFKKHLVDILYSKPYGFMKYLDDEGYDKGHRAHNLADLFCEVEDTRHHYGGGTDIDIKRTLEIFEEIEKLQKEADLHV